MVHLGDTAQPMELLTGPYHAAAFLLLGAGAAKLRRPAATAAVLATLRLPASGLVAVVLGAAEIALALAALVSPAALVALAVAASYLGFAGFVGLAMRRPGTVSSCGCFGQTGTPPGAIHLTVNLAAAAAAGLAAAMGVQDGLPAQLAADPVHAVAVSAVAALCAWLAALLLTVLPQALRAGSPSQPRSQPTFLPAPVVVQDGDR
jgi:hypothetical protein